MHGYRRFGDSVKYFKKLVDHLSQEPLQKMCLSDPSRTPSKKVQTLVEEGLRACAIDKNSIMGKHSMASATDWAQVRVSYHTSVMYGLKTYVCYF